VVAQLVPSTSDTLSERIRTYNAAIAGLVGTRADAGKKIVMVDMYSAFVANPAFKTEYMKDVVHPNNAGYAKMADVWYAAIAASLK